MPSRRATGEFRSVFTPEKPVPVTDLLPDSDRTGMVSALKTLGLARLVALTVFVGMLVVGTWGFKQSLDPARYSVNGAIDLAGEWEFHNGDLEPPLAKAAPFAERVIVPKQLPEKIRNKLKAYFWYRKTFQMPARFAGRELAISLGSIKGHHEVFWNGVPVGSGGRTGFAVYRVSSNLTKAPSVTLTVRVKKIESPFPGIVHFNPLSLGEAEGFDSHLDKYYFEVGLKPFLPAAAKFFLALVLLSYFLVSPIKREFLSFSIFVIFSASAGAMYSRFLPFYQEFYFRSAIHFLFSATSLMAVPWLAGDFCRLPEDKRSAMRAYGGSIGLVFLLATFLVPNTAAQISVYQITYKWMPLLACIPSAGICIWTAFHLDKRLLHRRIALSAFAFFLLLGATEWSGSAENLFNFHQLLYPELVDLGVIMGMAMVMLADFRVMSKRSDRAGKTVPKWFSHLLATGVSQAKIELPLVAMAVDTVAYTKILAATPIERRDELHAEIRNMLNFVIERFGAQKLSDGGDGALFGWDLPATGSGPGQWMPILEAGRWLSQAQGESFPIRFRVGIAAGIVRGEMREGDISFLGEALNAAARLESMSEPGVPLVDASIVEILGSQDLSEEWVEANLKGVVYRGKRLKKAA